MTSIAFPYVDPGQSPKTQFGLIDVVSHLPSVSSSLHQETDGEAHEMAMRMDLGRQRQPGETRPPAPDANQRHDDPRSGDIRPVLAVTVRDGQPGATGPPLAACVPHSMSASYEGGETVAAY